MNARVSSGHNPSDSMICSSSAGPRTNHNDDFERTKRQLSQLKTYKLIVADTPTRLILDGHCSSSAPKNRGIERFEGAAEMHNIWPPGRTSSPANPRQTSQWPN